ncbi:hypothetical protein ACFXCZ_34365 [Streptomyces sp. NPDC059396]|uniref:hypothetical protein n=1 Tax=Streptomyces sp. NPDC059396 TaxID=3346819 RepID=UPI00369959AB
MPYLVPSGEPTGLHYAQIDAAPELNVVVTMDHDATRAQAAEADRHRARGGTQRMLGLPVLFKGLERSRRSRRT